MNLLTIISEVSTILALIVSIISLFKVWSIEKTIKSSQQIANSKISNSTVTQTLKENKQ